MKKKLNRDYFIYIFFLIIFFIGIISYQDFGIYGDEPMHRSIGLIYYNHIKELLFNFNYNNLYLSQINQLAKDEYLNLWVQYPIFFDLITEFFIDIFGIKTTRGIFHLRHLILHLFFFFSLFFFYKVIQERFKNNLFSILGVLLVIASPRIFSESFYNSKDILFLSFTMFNLFFSLKFINSQSTKNLILYSISTGLLINSRIMGLVFPILTFSIIFFDILENKKILIITLKKIAISFLIITFVVFLFWPYMWSNTLEKLIFYLDFVRALDVFTNTYFGEILLSNQTPWHFRFVWIAITIPLVVLLFSIVGFFLLFRIFLIRIINLEKTNKIWLSVKERYDFYVFLLLVFPLLTILTFTNNFDGWRYYYYIYPFLVYLLLYLLSEILSKNYKFYKFFIFIILINLITSFYWMVKFHPHQYTYFNFIQKHIIKKSFNLDYMGLSIDHSLNYILKNDHRPTIKVSSLGETSVKGTSLILQKNQQERLKFVNYDDADYIIDTFRPKVGKKILIDTNIFSKYYELIVDKNIVNRIYKRK